MPDISMCADEDCLRRKSCYRLLAMPSQFHAHGDFRQREGMPKRETKVNFCVQGVISPMLLNIFLHHVLDAWFEGETKPRL